jgi:hypothetical protein
LPTVQYGIEQGGFGVDIHLPQKIDNK